MAARGLVNGRDGLQRMSCGHSCLNSRALARRPGPAPKEWEGFSFQKVYTGIILIIFIKQSDGFHSGEKLLQEVALVR